MLNAEKYRDEIFKRAEDNKVCYDNHNYPLYFAIDEISGQDLGLEGTVEWLLSEYEPTLLENGDGLKPGDWIMVKDKNNKWRKRAFIFFKDGIFYTVDMGHEISNSGRYSSWKEVRLPEEGE